MNCRKLICENVGRPSVYPITFTAKSNKVNHNPGNTREDYLQRSLDIDDGYATDDKRSASDDGLRAGSKITADKEKTAGQGNEPHPDLVDWETDGPERPVNWSNSKKCINLGLFFFFCFLTPLAPSMVARVIESKQFGS